MRKRLGQWLVAIFGCALIPLHAHHSIGMIDISAPVWVRGTVISYQVIHPHVMIALEQEGADGRIQRWAVEGPIVARLHRMGLDETLLKAGDVLEVCVFPYKGGLWRGKSFPGVDDPARHLVHGHLLRLADGNMQPWGPYGKLENCVRPQDRGQSWLQFLDSDPIARDLWCGKQRNSAPTIPQSQALIDEINRMMGVPCS